MLSMLNVLVTRDWKVIKCFTVPAGRACCDNSTGREIGDVVASDQEAQLKRHEVNTSLSKFQLCAVALMNQE